MNAAIEIWVSMDLVGQGICIILAIMSVYMWGLIFAKYVSLGAIQRGNKRIGERLRPFQAQYARDYLQIFRDFPVNSTNPLYVLYRACCDHVFAYDRIRVADVQAAEKLIDARLAEQVDLIEDGMGYLALTSTLAPFFGLLGTVWGILIAFRKMSTAGSAMVTSVAPGIAVALVTTVAGLVVAIPAITAFYYFKNRINTEIAHMETFCRELVARLERIVSEESTE
ncbi:MAG: MotA/TolQ/ExbB proton channel family protein [bacterium]|nr:MotA/TolQ/ExbB proton channel family protein [bacterium]